MSRINENNDSIFLSKVFTINEIFPNKSVLYKCRKIITTMSQQLSYKQKAWKAISNLYMFSKVIWDF